ncbi:uncharacterized protein LOC128220489 isoform X2 [Mya arenaria]|uniref:uncharacterized protein LOC128220489 isoform X2 n=1 Tax=Mya arenaria TaxID=6604 RepID=UPI0022E73195|nr:uncharacterized protein LOC128220489 isoform X2 [Mya arenaria]
MTEPITPKDIETAAIMENEYKIQAMLYKTDQTVTDSGHDCPNISTNVDQEDIDLEAVCESRMISPSQDETLASPNSCKETVPGYKYSVVPIPPNDTSSSKGETITSSISCNEAVSDYNNDAVSFPSSDTLYSKDETLVSPDSCNEVVSDNQINDVPFPPSNTSSTRDETLASPISCNEAVSDNKNNGVPLPPSDTQYSKDETLVSPNSCNEVVSDNQINDVPFPPSNTSSTRDETLASPISCNEAVSDNKNNGVPFPPSDTSSSEVEVLALPFGCNKTFPFTKLKGNDTNIRSTQNKETSDTYLDTETPLILTVHQVVLIYFQMRIEACAIVLIMKNLCNKVISLLCHVTFPHQEEKTNIVTRQQMFKVSDEDDRITKHSNWTNLFRPLLPLNESHKIKSSVYPILFTEEDLPHDVNQNVIEQTGRLIEPENIHCTFETIPFPVSSSGSLTHACPLPALENAGTYRRAENYTDEETDGAGGPTLVPEAYGGTLNQHYQAARRNNGNDHRILCMMCQRFVRKVVFLPCGHLLYCRQCDPQIKNCGQCRSLIIQKVFIQD